ncbi:metallophosphoesterase [Komagataeibacter intermedius]|uniref:Metallophosphoesterase n=1 Tax=Komagataeibacter intermedius AF2 TaxID=1458464 RepID=A0A0N1FML6_9PROT|nr:metallophosphoesterase [Komagataeibacter intermedius]KPH88002.1 metallophosphoesterase [Komagataeibacter intermedius AF2]MCF3635966.1 metallophosphoesterase [Komagataeibacter intermedius]GAN87654.1 phosphoesterase [Komagataeibacter intermedius TF2]
MRLVVFGLPLLVVILNWLWPLPLPLGLKIPAAALVVIAAFYHYWSRLSSGSIFAPEFPRPVVILFNWAFGAIGFLTLLQIALDLGALLVALVTWQPVQIPVGARAVVGGIAGVLSAIGVANALRVPPVRDVTVTIPGLSPAFDGYRLVQLTDMHISRLFPARWARAVVDRTNAAGADMIVVTGDFIDGSVAMRRADVAPLAGLHAPDGVLAVPGNHEYFFDYADWMHHLSELGFHMLLNHYMVITRGGGARLIIAGVTDRSAPGHGQAGPDLVAALAGRPAGVPVILLDHQPCAARAAAAQGVALQLSGHTHGGMIVGLDRLVARGNNGFVSGCYDLGGMTLYVSNGTGLWPGFALRLGRPSEITCFHLRAG